MPRGVPNIGSSKPKSDIVKNARKRALKKLAGRRPGVTDKPVLDENGTPSGLTLPIQEVNLRSYERELMSKAQEQVLSRVLATIPADDLKTALAYDNGTKAMKFLADLIDPAKQGIDIAELALRNRIGLGELMNVYRNERLACAVAAIFTQVPIVAKHTAEDAQTFDTCCSRCDGAGEIRVERKRGQEWIRCVACEGTGKSRRVRDSRSREHMLKATGIIKPDQHTVVVNNTQISGPESLLDELDRLNSPSVIEVESDAS